MSRPHSDPDWTVLMTVRLDKQTKVGTIFFKRARVDYTAGGPSYWQYMHVNTDRVMNHLPT